MNRVGLRLVLATVATLTAAHLWSRDVVTLLMPALSSALSAVADDFKILRFDFVSDRGNASIGALALLDHTLVLDGRAIVPDGVSPMLVGTTVGTVVQPLLVTLVLVLAWPAGPIEMAWRLAVAAVLDAVVLLVDTPLSMAAWLWEVQLRAHAPDRTSLLVSWNIFLNSGGRLALGLIAGVLAIALAQRVRGFRSFRNGAASVATTESADRSRRAAA
ncbi:MAG: hypothetical protein QFE16_07750 [Pseudomonadota bacterium]|nr:hypothetical protein [Pseudomonadota bacterium]